MSIFEKKNNFKSITLPLKKLEKESETKTKERRKKNIYIFKNRTEINKIKIRATIEKCAQNQKKKQQYLEGRNETISTFR